MPREQIQYERRVPEVGSTGEPTPESETHYSAPLLHITWHGNGTDGAGWVQVSLETERGWLKQLLTDAEGENTIMLFSDVLTRDECNKAIKHLRRGRERAYGRDE